MSRHRFQSIRRLSVLIVGVTAIFGTLVVASPASASPCFASSAGGLMTDLATSSCSTINLAQGTYTGNFAPNHNVNVVGYAETTTILSGGGSGTVFTNSGGYTVYLTNLTITDGSSSSSPGAGGVVNAPGGDLTLRNTIVTANETTGACFGGGATSGGIYNKGTMVLVATNVTRNNSGIPGCSGGIANDFGGTMTISSNSMVSQNIGGGGVANFGTLDMYQSSVTNNSNVGLSLVLGGGLFSQGTLYMSGIAVTGNVAGSRTDQGIGGGLYTQGATTIVGGLIANNSALAPSTGGLGGGIYKYLGTLNMTGSGGVDHNFATGDGGGIFEGGGAPNIAPSITVEGNQPDDIS